MIAIGIALGLGLMCAIPWRIHLSKGNMEEAQAGFLGVLIFGAIAGLFLVLMIRSYKISKEVIAADLETSQKNYDVQKPQLLKRINSLDNMITECRNVGAPLLEFLPEKYRNIHATTFMLEALQNLRADTLKEVINLYEAELSNIKMYNQTQLEMQLQQQHMEAIQNVMQDIHTNQESIRSDLFQMKAIQFYDTINK